MSKIGPVLRNKTGDYETSILSISASKIRLKLFFLHLIQEACGGGHISNTFDQIPVFHVARRPRQLLRKASKLSAFANLKITRAGKRYKLHLVPAATKCYVTDLCISTNDIHVPGSLQPIFLLFFGSLPHYCWYKHYKVE